MSDESITREDWAIFHPVTGKFSCRDEKHARGMMESMSPVIGVPISQRVLRKRTVIETPWEDVPYEAPPPRTFPNEVAKGGPKKGSGETLEENLGRFPLTPLLERFPLTPLEQKWGTITCTSLSSDLGTQWAKVRTHRWGTTDGTAVGARRCDGCDRTARMLEHG